jgi:hypothetical protein
LLLCVWILEGKKRGKGEPVCGGFFYLKLPKINLINTDGLKVNLFS